MLIFCESVRRREKIAETRLRLFSFLLFPFISYLISYYVLIDFINLCSHLHCHVHHFSVAIKFQPGNLKYNKNSINKCKTKNIVRLLFPYKTKETFRTT